MPLRIIKVRSNRNGFEANDLIGDGSASAALLRKEVAKLAKDADRLHKRIGGVHVIADRLHRKIEQTHGQIRIYRSRNRMARRE